MQIGVTRIESEWGNCRLSFDVRSGAEGASSASQDHDFDTGIFIQEIKRVLELKPEQFIAFRTLGRFSVIVAIELSVSKRMHS